MVAVGLLAKNACSEFISIEEFDKRKSHFPALAKNLDLEVLRRSWTKEREHVENVGRPVVISRNGSRVAALVPTDQGLKEIKATQSATDTSPNDLLALIAKQVCALTKQMAEVHKSVLDLQRASLDPDDVAMLRQGRGILHEIVKEWRDLRQYKGDGPTGSGSSQ